MMKKSALCSFAVLTGLAAGCGSTVTTKPAPSAAAVATPDPRAPRPASPVTIEIISPTPSQVIRGSTMTVVVKITGGTITTVTSTHVNPTVGHVHLYYDDNLIYMSYTLTQVVPVHAGENGTIKAEFVASDHFPFSPRDVTPPVFFSVQA